MRKNEESIPLCTHNIGNTENIKRSRELIPDDITLYELSDFYKIFADSTRLKILYAIQTEMCVCEIASTLGMTISAVSHQLKILKQSDLVRYRKEGKNVYYRIADDHVKKIIDCALEHIKE